VFWAQPCEADPVGTAVVACAFSRGRAARINQTPYASVKTRFGMPKKRACTSNGTIMPTEPQTTRAVVKSGTADDRVRRRNDRDRKSTRTVGAVHQS
jgi:hypothetical protein